MNLQDSYKRRIQKSLVEFFSTKFSAELPSELFFSIPPAIEFGHIALPCFEFAKILKRSPQQIATQIAEGFPKTEGLKKVIAKSAYLNFFLDLDPLCKQIQSTITTPEFFQNDLKAGKEILVEYSSPNTNKPLHLGHGRNNMLGFAISNLFMLSGAKVIQANLINDRGIHICKSMLAYEKFGDSKTPESETMKGDHFVGNYYVLYARHETPEMKKEGEQMLRDWEAGNPEVHALWHKMKNWVLDGIKETYERMNINFDRYYYESETYKHGKEEILRACEKNICETEENGAISIDLSEFKLGKKILLRADGTSVYITQDIFTTIQKFRDYPLDETLFVVGNEQEHHFRTLFSVLKKFGYDWADSCRHISYGMIELPEGKMKSREGTVVDLDNLLDELQAKAGESLATREKSRENPRSKNELKEVAEAVGQAALKYFILKTGITKNMVFFPDESLAFEGNTGPYLQYTHARITTLLKKAEFLELNFPVSCNWNVLEESLLILIFRCPDAIRNSAKELNPAHLANYCYDLAKAFNKLYGELQILKAPTDPEINLRLSLCLSCKIVLAKCLETMGIKPPERM